MFDGGTRGGDDLVGGLLGGGELLLLAGPLDPGDDDRVVGVVVQADEPEVSQGPESGIA